MAVDIDFVYFVHPPDDSQELILQEHRKELNKMIWQRTTHLAGEKKRVRMLEETGPTKVKATYEYIHYRLAAKTLGEGKWWWQGSDGRKHSIAY